QHRSGHRRAAPRADRARAQRGRAGPWHRARARGQDHRRGRAGTRRRHGARPPPGDVMNASHRYAGRRVAVVMGGLSAEREVSLNTGAGVVAALAEKSWDVVAIDWQPGTSLPRLLEQSGAQVVWNALHGTW